MPDAAATAPHHRHDISDRAWGILEPIIPSGPGKVGCPAQNNRRFSNAVFWVLRTGAPERDLPPDYGDGCATHRRFSRWRQNGTRAKLLDAVSNDPDLEWLMIDGSYVKVHQHGMGAWGGNQAIGRTKKPAPYLIRGADYESPSGDGCPRDAGSDAGYGGARWRTVPRQ